MPALSDFSINNLNTCDQRIQVVTIEVAKIYDIRVLEGKRTWARQRQLFMEERTTLMPPSSKHTPDTEGDTDWLSMAVDIAPYPIDWKDAKRFCYLVSMTSSSDGVVTGTWIKLSSMIRISMTYHTSRSLNNAF